jgi:hypothetical protein
MYRRLFAWFLLLITMIVIMQWQGRTLVTFLSTHGILDLEFAHTLQRLKQLKTVWTNGNVYTNLLLDFVFIFVYIRFFLECCGFIAARTGWERACRTIGYLAITAGILDVLENLSLLVAWSQETAGLVEAAYYFAILKFILLFIVIIFIIVSFARIVFTKMPPPPVTKA